MIEMALSYAKQGWDLIPINGVEVVQSKLQCACGDIACKAPGKHPLISLGRGLSNASHSPEIITNWLTRWPNANLAVSCGASGILVVDCDIQDSEDGTIVDGETELLGWCGARGFELPATLRQRTGSGGTHFFFNRPSGLDIKNRRVLDAVDIKCEGGYVLLPPSLHIRGNRYEWIDNSPMSDVPCELHELLTGSRKRNVRAGRAKSGSDAYRKAKQAGSGPRLGNRDDFFIARAYELRRMGCSVETALSDLREKYEARERSPDDEYLWSSVTEKIGRIWSDIDPDDTRSDGDEGLMRINAGDKNLPRITNQAWQALDTSDDRSAIYRRGGEIVRLEQSDDGEVFPQPLDQYRMVHELSRNAHWYQIVRGKEKDASPPLAVARDMLSNPAPPLRKLYRIVQAPVFGLNGSLQTESGYHVGSSTFYAPKEGLDIPGVSDSPSVSEVQKAISLIQDELLVDFPFAGDAERAHAIGLFLLPYVRDLIVGPTPLHLIEKPRAGTGGTLLANILMSPVLGTLSAMAAPNNDEEWRKRITAHLRSGPEAFFIDNVRRLESPSLSAALTAVSWNDRILGNSSVAHFPVRCIWIATGNNPKLSVEVARRVVRIRLESPEDRPWLRTEFKHRHIEAWAREHRGELIWAALTLVRNWQAKGSPRPDEPRLGSYETWSAVIGGILAAAGGKSFLANMNEMVDLAEEEDESEYQAFIEAWWRRHGETPLAAIELVDIAEENGLLGSIQSGSKARAISVGKRLSSIRGRIFPVPSGNVCVAHRQKSHNVTLWLLRKL
jgi:bifunctional DNA primase/polymerase-like protein